MATNAEPLTIEEEARAIVVRFSDGYDPTLAAFFAGSIALGNSRALVTPRLRIMTTLNKRRIIDASFEAMLAM